MYYNILLYMSLYTVLALRAKGARDARPPHPGSPWSGSSLRPEQFSCVLSCLLSTDLQDLRYT